LKLNSAFYWFILYGYITMHGQQNIKLDVLLYSVKVTVPATFKVTNK